jgi:hypothetical protein
MRSLLACAVVFFGVVSACATAGGGGLKPAGDAGKKDSGGTQTDGGGGNDGGGTTTDSGGPKPDGGGGCVTAPPSNVCGVYPQCGCAAQQTCEVDQTALDGTSSCVQAGSKGLGQGCTATTGQCAPGLTCVWNTCHAYCGTDGAKCTNANTNYCVNLTDSNQAPIPNLLVCHNDCELSDPNSCGGGSEGCLYFDTDKVDCYPVGTSTANCNATTSFCPPGQICLTDQTNYFCLPWCRIGMNDCTSGTCNSLGTSPPTVNGQEYGYCQ